MGSIFRTDRVRDGHSPVFRQEVLMCEPSREQEKDYVDCGGLRCPFCGSESVECWGPFTTGENGQGWQKMECGTCEEVWEEIYQLSGIRFL